MLIPFTSRAFALAFLGILGLGLAACTPLAAQTDPHHQFILQVDTELAAERAGEGADIEALVEASLSVIIGRLESMGVTVTGATMEGANRLVINVAGENSGEAVETAIGRGAELDFKLVDETVSESDIEQNLSPRGSIILPMADGSGPIAVRQLGGISGSHIVDASVRLDPDSAQHAIAMRFDEKGARKLAALTTANVGNPMAIILDGEVYTVPIIYEPIIGGELQISGNFTEQDTNELAIMLGSGALPVPFVIIEERSPD